jgi:tRNA dimethylallyltransferase
VTKPTVLFIVGPTASGKSALAVALAKKLGGEVLSADSMLVYQGMDVGTAKPTKKERGGIPHHGIDLTSPSQNFSVFAFRQYALKAIKDIVKRGKIPIVAGGTGFYVRALLEGLSPLPGTNAQIRGKLEREAREKGLPALYSRLLKIDPSRAKAIGPHNQRRIIRALEIYLTSGKKPSKSGPKAPGLKQLGYRPIVIGIHRDREALYGKINRRVDTMFRKGLMREVKRLARKKLSKTALQGVGYKETLDWLQGGCERPLAEVKDRIKQATRHFAKRQWTWFKRECGIRWVWWPEQSAMNDVCHYIRFYILNRCKDVGCRMSDEVKNCFSTSIVRHPKGGN